MMRDLFCDVELSGYQKLRAIMATLNNVGLLAHGSYPNSHELRAEMAIDAAEALLDLLGIVDPDTIAS